jgi:RNA polymerase sigma-70 factor (ECF subfamily)
MRTEDNLNNSAALWQKFKAGETQAFAELYNRYIHELLNYGYKITPDAGLLQDSIHDLFVELWKSKEQLGFTDNPKFYLFKALRHKLARNLVTIPIFVSPQQKENLFETLQTDATDYGILKHEQDALNSRLVQQLLSKLTSRQKEVIHLRFFQNFSYSDIAKIMDMNYQSALNLVQRAFVTLRQEIRSASGIIFLLCIIAATISTF